MAGIGHRMHTSPAGIAAGIARTNIDSPVVMTIPVKAAAGNPIAAAVTNPWSSWAGANR